MRPDEGADDRSPGHAVGHMIELPNAGSRMTAVVHVRTREFAGRRAANATTTADIKRTDDPGTPSEAARGQVGRQTPGPRSCRPAKRLSSIPTTVTTRRRVCCARSIPARQELFTGLPRGQVRSAAASRRRGPGQVPAPSGGQRAASRDRPRREGTTAVTSRESSTVVGVLRGLTGPAVPPVRRRWRAHQIGPSEPGPSSDTFDRFHTRSTDSWAA